MSARALRRARAALALAGALSAAAGCRAPSASPEPKSAGAPAARGPVGPLCVTGTVVEAATGRPVADARVEGPAGAVAVTDARGRFRLEGLSSGAQGKLVALGANGLRGENRLRPLAVRTLEVVIYLR